MNKINNYKLKNMLTPEELEYRLNETTYNYEVTLVNEPGEVTRYIYDRIPVSKSFLDSRAYTFNEYVNSIKALDPNYVFPIKPDVPVVEFVWRYVASENAEHMILPLLVDKPVLREVIINGVEVFNPPYDPTTRTLQINLNVGDRVKISY